MKHAAIAVFALFLAQAPASAQSIGSIVPSASSPGYVVTVEGTNLQFTMCVQFRAVVGGFVGVRTVEAPALTVSNTRVTALVPEIGGFIPPGEAQAGDPLGEVTVIDFFGLQTETLPFYFLEGTGGAFENAGAATTQANGEQAAISFSLANGAPDPGNPVFTPLLQNADPGSPAALFFGRPSTPPFPIFGGEFAVNPVIVAASAPLVDASGETSRTFAIPALTVLQGQSFVMQWGFIDSTPSVQFSNALRMNY
ncbi:MAG: hypothetical protein KDB80_11280 [Planctomycetes bacterium]|nr:hypothetical protein [Planctomycetota bacterium]